MTLFLSFYWYIGEKDWKALNKLVESVKDIWFVGNIFFIPEISRFLSLLISDHFFRLSLLRVWTRPLDHLVRDLHVDQVAASIVGVDVAKDFILSFSSFFSTSQKKFQRPVLSFQLIQKQVSNRLFINDVMYLHLYFLLCLTKPSKILLERYKWAIFS